MDDATLLRGLTARFERQPLLATAKLGISVEDGVAVLSGYTGEGATKAVAELTAMEMPGIRAVVNEIETTAEETWRYVDCRIAKKACDLLEWNALTPANLRIRVEHGRLSIFGCVAGDDHFRVISMILADFSGARSIDNHLKIAPHDEDEISSRLVTA
jgi:osmotically-inducible protein OsmY